MRHATLKLGGEWGNCVGEIDRHGVVFFWGGSGNGKTSAVVSFCKELTRFGRVLYIPLEEKYSLSIQDTLRRFGMQECGKRFQLLDSFSFEDLEERLCKQRSPEFIVIDSFQYTRMSYKDYIRFKERWSNKLLIFVSHANGRQPAGKPAIAVMYDAMLKIWVEGHVAMSKGRFMGRTQKAVIWRHGAELYWGTGDFGEGELVRKSEKQK